MNLAGRGLLLQVFFFSAWEDMVTLFPIRRFLNEISTMIFFLFLEKYCLFAFGKQCMAWILKQCYPRFICTTYNLLPFFRRFRNLFIYLVQTRSKWRKKGRTTTLEEVSLFNWRDFDLFGKQNLIQVILAIFLVIFEIFVLSNNLKKFKQLLLFLRCLSFQRKFIHWKESSPHSIRNYVPIRWGSLALTEQSNSGFSLE